MQGDKLGEINFSYRRIGLQLLELLDCELNFCQFGGEQKHVLNRPFHIGYTLAGANVDKITSNYSQLDFFCGKNISEVMKMPCNNRHDAATFLSTRYRRGRPNDPANNWACCRSNGLRRKSYPCAALKDLIPEICGQNTWRVFSAFLRYFIVLHANPPNIRSC